MSELEQKKKHTIEFRTKEDLRRAYMPFIKNGGLFVASKENCQLNQFVLLQVQLLEEKEIFELKGKIGWITPLGAQGGLKAGFGVQLDQNEQTDNFLKKVETYLAGTHHSDKPTDTL